MPDDALSKWIDQKRLGAIRSLRSAVSATHLAHKRPGFGATLRPIKGSVLASPHRALWDPEPDYFYHWVRDAAIVMRVLPCILDLVGEADASWWRKAFSDYVAFSLKISDPVTAPLSSNPLATTSRTTHKKYLRSDAELSGLTGAALLEEPRFAPDGTVDLERWNRPQDDGPALRASSTIAVIRSCPELASRQTAQLIQRDLRHTEKVAGRPSIGPWEDPPCQRDTFTLIAQWNALKSGSQWLKSQGQDGASLRTRAAEVMGWINAAADPHQPAWRTSVESDAGAFDSATILAILHAEQKSGPLSITAPRTLGTVAALEKQFETLYPINTGRKSPAIGRWSKDDYFGGNPWFPVTLGFAELHFRMAALTRDHEHFERADGWFALIRDVLPESDALPEQFDRSSGAAVSSLALSWSAAAFIAAADARERAFRGLQKVGR